jgi:transcription elongation factor SPT5
MTAAEVARLAAGTPRSTPQSPAHGGGARYGYAPQSPLSFSRGAGGEIKPLAPRNVVPQAGAEGGGGFGGGGGGPRGVVAALIGKVVKVCGGAYHGYRGRVKQESDLHVQVRLHG